MTLIKQYIDIKCKNNINRVKNESDNHSLVILIPS